MPHKVDGEPGCKSKTRSKKDASRRTFELYGTYSAKHLRLRAETAANRASNGAHGAHGDATPKR